MQISGHFVSTSMSGSNLSTSVLQMSCRWRSILSAATKSTSVHPKNMHTVRSLLWFGTSRRVYLYGSWLHYSDVIMSAMASLITSLTSVYSIVHPGADQRKHQSSASLAFVRGIHRRPVNSPHKWPVTRKMFPFDDVIMTSLALGLSHCARAGEASMKNMGYLWRLHATNRETTSIDILNTKAPCVLLFFVLFCLFLFYMQMFVYKNRIRISAFRCTHLRFTWYLHITK